MYSQSERFRGGFAIVGIITGIIRLRQHIGKESNTQGFGLE